MRGLGDHPREKEVWASEHLKNKILELAGLLGGELWSDGDAEGRARPYSREAYFETCVYVGMTNIGVKQI